MVAGRRYSTSSLYSLSHPCRSSQSPLLSYIGATREISEAIGEREREMFVLDDISQRHESDPAADA